MSKLEIKTVSKHYEKKKALDGFTFTFTKGIYGLLGPNGAGKTTLMNLITGNLSADKDGGKILWNGEETSSLGEKFRKELGFMPQQQNLYDSMTAFDFLGYVSALKNLDKKKSTEEILSLLKKVELDDCADKKIGGFSGGMKQRLLIASALLGSPKLLIMDEPTNHLDVQAKEALKSALMDFAGTVLLVSHEEAFYREWAQRVISVEK